MKLRKLNQNNYAVSHQLVNITSMTVFICIVLVAIINSVPLSPDTTVYSYTMDKKSIALQTTSILIDTPGKALDGSPCWEDVKQSGNILYPESIGFRMNYSYNVSNSNITSNNLRLLSLKKIKALTSFDTTTGYETLKTEVFNLPSYFEYNISINFQKNNFDNISYGPSMEGSSITVTKTINAVVYDPDRASPTYDNYDYAKIRVRIS